MACPTKIENNERMCIFNGCLCINGLLLRIYTYITNIGKYLERFGAYESGSQGAFQLYECYLYFTGIDNKYFSWGY